MPRPQQKIIQLTVDGREVRARRGHDARRRRQAGRRRDPVLLLRAEARPPGRRLPHVPGRDRGDPEAPDVVLDAGQGRDGRPHPDRARPPRAERDRRVPARQPSARLPGLRQGRRVPAAGHHVRLGPRALALHRAQAPLREAAGALPAGRDRPRALHPLLPLRALLAGDRRGLPADLRRARRAHVRRDPRRPSVRRAVQRQHHRAVPGRRADLASRTASAPARGTSRAPAGSARCARRSATSRSPSATRRCCACWRASTPRSTTAGCATRAASPTRRSTSTSGSPRRWCATAASCARSRGSGRSRSPPGSPGTRATSARSSAARPPTRRASCSSG